MANIPGSTTVAATVTKAYGAASVLTGQPICSETPDDPACLTFSKSATYIFPFTGATTWSCLNPTSCGVPATF